MPAPTLENVARPPLAIPPPQVVWAWLNYFYQTTGKWVMPPVSEETFTAHNSATEASLPFTSDCYANNANASLSENTCLSDTTTSSAQNSAVAKPLDNNRQDTPFLAYQFPFPNLVAYAPVSQNSSEPVSDTVHPSKKRTKTRQTTGFDYLNSAYFEEAERLIEATGSPNYTIKPELLFGAKLLLTIIVAWCHFPLFKAMSGRTGRWMTLAFDQLAREGVRAASIKPLIRELQNARLIAPGLVATEAISREEFERLRYDLGRIEQELGIEARWFWPLRGIQEKSNIYRLLVETDLLLPDFNPFPLVAPPKGKKKVSWKDVEEDLLFSEKGKDCHGKDVTLPQHSLTNKVRLASELGGASNVLSTSFQATPTPINFNKGVVEVDEVEKEKSSTISQALAEKLVSSELVANKPTRGQIRKARPYSPNRGTPQIKKARSETRLDRIITGMRPIQRANYDYLREEAYFSDNNGLIFETAPGHFTLDKRGAVRLAVLEECTVEKLRQHHAQVREKWLAGECYNPLGLFYCSVLWDQNLSSVGEPIASFTEMVNRKASYEGLGTAPHPQNNPNLASEIAEEKVKLYDKNNLSSASTRGNHSRSQSAKPVFQSATVERGGTVARNEQAGTGVSGFQTGRRFYPGGTRSAYSRRGEGQSGRPGNPDCTNYDQW